MNFEQALLAAVIAEAGAIAVLFRLGVSHFRKVNRKLDDCEIDRLKLWEKLAKLESKQ